MSDDLITPGQGGGASDQTRKVSNGWRAIKDGGRESRQQRILREQQEKVERVKNGLPAEKENGFRPGEEEVSGEFSLRRMREATQKLVKTTMQKREFVGSPDQCIMKLVMLFNGTEDADGRKTTPKSTPQILSVDESGFGKYKITYIV